MMELNIQILYLPKMQIAPLAVACTSTFLSINCILLLENTSITAALADHSQEKWFSHGEMTQLGNNAWLVSFSLPIQF